MPDTDPPRGRGRPPNTPETQRVKRGVSLPLATWEALASIAQDECLSIDRMVQALIENHHK